MIAKLSKGRIGNESPDTQKIKDLIEEIHAYQGETKIVVDLVRLSSADAAELRGQLESICDAMAACNRLVRWVAGRNGIIFGPCNKANQANR